jgi:hypothetical protein
MKIYVLSHYDSPKHLVYPLRIFTSLNTVHDAARLNRDADIFTYQLTEHFPEIPIEKVYYVKGIRYSDKGKYVKVEPAILFNEYEKLREHIREEVKRYPTINGVQISESYLSLQEREKTRNPELYKFRYPEKGEENLRFMVIEDRGNRVLVREVSQGMPIPPQYVYLKSDLVRDK